MCNARTKCFGQRDSTFSDYDNKLGEKSFDTRLPMYFDIINRKIWFQTNNCPHENSLPITKK